MSSWGNNMKRIIAIPALAATMSALAETPTQMRLNHRTVSTLSFNATKTEFATCVFDHFNRNNFFFKAVRVKRTDDVEVVVTANVTSNVGMSVFDIEDSKAVIHVYDDVRHGALSMKWSVESATACGAKVTTSTLKDDEMDFVIH
jgi:hypothetical protein